MQGIYSISNLVNGKVYIGSSIRIEDRWFAHKKHLINNIYCNKHLQLSWNKFGEGGFEFKIIEEVPDKNQLPTREQYWIDEKKSYLRICGYNFGKHVDCAFRGIKRGPQTKEHKDKLSISHLGHKLGPQSEERKQKAVEARMKNHSYNHSEETKKKIGSKNLGKHRSVEAKENMSLAQLNRTRDHAEKIRLSRLGKKLNKITRRWE